MTEVLEHLSEEEIIKRAQARDNDAVDFLMQKYKSVVRRKTRTLFMFGSDRDDLIQEGMIGLFKAIRDYEIGKEASFATFAELCISRQLYSAIKSSNRQKNLPLNTYISIDTLGNVTDEQEKEGVVISEQSLAHSGMSPEEILINRENAENAKEKLVQCLSKMEREVLELYLGGLTYQEIALEMHKEPKAIDNALQRIKSKVNKQIMS